MIGEVGANEIGNAAKSGDINTAAQYIAHAALGCAVGAVGGGDCASGATGGVVGELTGDIYKTLTEDDLVDALASGKFEDWERKGVDLARLSSALVAFATGLDVDTAAGTGENAAKNNVFFVPALIAMAIAAYTVQQGDGDLVAGIDKIIAGQDTLGKLSAELTRQGVEEAYAIAPGGAAPPSRT